jgi:hypothetical protein
MDWADWAMLITASVYWLFNIKKIYSFIRWSINENGIWFTIGLLVFASIFLVGVILAFTAPQYGWIPQWALIWFIVGFFVCRFLFGIPK